MGYVALYLVAIVLANLSVAAFGPSVVVFNAFLFIGLDLTARDQLHEAWRNDNLLPKMAALIATSSSFRRRASRDLFAASLFFRRLSQ